MVSWMDGLSVRNLFFSLMPKMDNFLHENHWGSRSLLNVINVLNVLNVHNVLKMYKDYKDERMHLKLCQCACVHAYVRVQIWQFPFWPSFPYEFQQFVIKQGPAGQRWALGCIKP